MVEFLKPEAGGDFSLTHLLELVPPGTRDEEWVPSLKDGGWTVLSADGARKPNKNRGGKLPLLRVESKIPLILLSPRVHGRMMFDEMRTIVSVWEEILAIASDPDRAGMRHRIEPSNPENSGVGKIGERPLRRPPSGADLA